jgi:HD-GYP domain-containing protein (c-di-GMP phosphodiesterase class II)
MAPYNGILGRLVLVAAMAIAPIAVLHYVGGEKVILPAIVHLTVVGISAGAAFGASLALTVAGTRRRDGRVVLLATAFTAMAALLLVHGLATPGFLVGRNGLVAFSGAATLPIGGAILALSALSPFRRPRRAGPIVGLQVGLFGGIVGVSVVGMVSPALVPGVPEVGSSGAIALMAAGLVFYGVLMLRAFNTFLLTRRFADVLVVCGILWLGVALVAALTLDYWYVGWWVGHGLEVAGIALIGSTIGFDLHRAAQSRPLLGDFRAAELVAEEEAFLGSQVHALLIRLAEKDEYTEGHTRRVALLAVATGEELGLPAQRLRSLALGGLLHDIGKLGVPDAILGKPGALTEAEFDVIREHPEHGGRLLRELGGFRGLVVRLVEGHHERLDGTGYPRGLEASELELEVRIMAVCDVYDALSSPRVYRKAWTPEAAMELLHREAGTKLDARCVTALEKVVAELAREGTESRGLPGPARAAASFAPLAPQVATAFAAEPRRIDGQLG